MDNRTISRSFNQADIKDGVIIQGDENSVKIGADTQEFVRLHALLLDEISSLHDKSQRDQASYLADDLKEAYHNKDQVKAGRIIRLMTNILGVTGSLASIASLFGVIL